MSLGEQYDIQRVKELEKENEDLRDTIKSILEWAKGLEDRLRSLSLRHMGDEHTIV